MLDLSAYRTICTSSPARPSGPKVSSGGGEMLAVGYVKCPGCRTVTPRGSVDFRLLCFKCSEACPSCRRELQDDGTCLVCVELEVATDIDNAERLANGTADVLGNQVRRPVMVEDDEFNAYSGGVYEYNVNDVTIDDFRAFDRQNEEARDLRVFTDTNGVCAECHLELSTAEMGLAVHRDCED